MSRTSNASQTQLGLRYRHDIDPDGGLLIVQSLAAPALIQISTDGQSLPVDLLFVASDGTVMEVHSWIPTDSSTPITPTRPVAAALELAGGTIIRYGILPGDHVVGGGLGLEVTRPGFVWRNLSELGQTAAECSPEFPTTSISHNLPSTDVF